MANHFIYQVISKLNLWFRNLMTLVIDHALAGEIPAFAHFKHVFRFMDPCVRTVWRTKPAHEILALRTDASLLGFSKVLLLLPRRHVLHTVTCVLMERTSRVCHPCHLATRRTCGPHYLDALLTQHDVVPERYFITSHLNVQLPVILLQQCGQCLVRERLCPH